MREGFPIPTQMGLKTTSRVDVFSLRSPIWKPPCWQPWTAVLRCLLSFANMSENIDEKQLLHYGKLRHSHGKSTILDGICQERWGNFPWWFLSLPEVTQIPKLVEVVGTFHAIPRDTCGPAYGPQNIGRLQIHISLRTNVKSQEMDLL